VYAKLVYNSAFVKASMDELLQALYGLIYKKKSERYYSPGL
jgi:hypothetical protein